MEGVKGSAAFAQGWVAAGSAVVAMGSASKPMAAMAVVGLVEDWGEVAKAVEVAMAAAAAAAAAAGWVEAAEAGMAAVGSAAAGSAAVGSAVWATAVEDLAAAGWVAVTARQQRSWVGSRCCLCTCAGMRPAGRRRGSSW